MVPGETGSTATKLRSAVQNRRSDSGAPMPAEEDRFQNERVWLRHRIERLHHLLRLISDDTAIAEIERQIGELEARLAWLQANAKAPDRLH